MSESNSQTVRKLAWLCLAFLEGLAILALLLISLTFTRWDYSGELVFELERPSNQIYFWSLVMGCVGLIVRSVLLRASRSCLDFSPGSMLLVIREKLLLLMFLVMTTVMFTNQRTPLGMQRDNQFIIEQIGGPKLPTTKEKFEKLAKRNIRRNLASGSGSLWMLIALFGCGHTTSRRAFWEKGK